MTNRERRKLQKRKTKEQIDRKKLLLERERRTKERQALALQERQKKELRKSEVEKDRLEAWANQIVENMPKLPEETRKQIEHNIEVLKALEEEYEAEMASKRALSDKLSGEECDTLEKKLKVMEEKLCLQTVVEEDIGVGGSAICSFTPAVENKENS